MHLLHTKKYYSFLDINCEINKLIVYFSANNDSSYNYYYLSLIRDCV